MNIPALLAAFLLSGCASLGYGGMSPEMIKEATKDKNASAVCTEFIGTGGKFTSLYMNTDKSTIVSGSASLKCGSAEATFTDQGKAAAGVKP